VWLRAELLLLEMWIEWLGLRPLRMRPLLLLEVVWILLRIGLEASLVLTIRILNLTNDWPAGTRA
jgi:hypothetical protein